MPAKPPSITRALAASARATKPGPADQAGLALAKRYAARLDGAQAVVELADRAFAAAAVDGDAGAGEVIAVLRAKLDVRAVESDIGPKLLAVLAALKMTPAARAAPVTGGDAGGGDDALSRLRARYAQHAGPH